MSYRAGQTVYRIRFDAQGNPLVQVGKCVSVGIKDTIKVQYDGKREPATTWHKNLNSAIVMAICVQRYRMNVADPNRYDPWLAVEKICKLKRLHDKLGRHGLIEYGE